jgi:hypothetical protein
MWKIPSILTRWRKTKSRYVLIKEYREAILLLQGLHAYTTLIKNSQTNRYRREWFVDNRIVAWEDNMSHTMAMVPWRDRVVGGSLFMLKGIGGDDANKTNCK